MREVSARQDIESDLTSNDIAYHCNGYQKAAAKVLLSQCEYDQRGYYCESSYDSN